MQTTIRTLATLTLGGLAWLSYLSPQPSIFIFFAIMALLACVQYLVWRKGCGLGKREIILWALAFRIPAWVGQPLYEDDFYRYLWDGREFATTGNPYGKPPAEASEPPEPFRDILAHVNFPEIATIYGPVCQYTFAAAYAIKPGSVGALKFVYAIFDIATALVLFRLAPSALVLYLWSPLVIKEIAFTAHTDILAAFFSIACLLAIRRDSPLWAGILCGLAAGSKVTAMLLIPLFLVEIATSPRILRFGATFAATVAALYLPFYRASESEGLAAFLGAWEFNSFAFAVLKEWVGFAPARNICFAAAAGAIIALTVKALRHRETPAYSQALGWFSLFSPVVNPWYLVLWLPFAALRAAPWSIVAMSTVLLSYATGINLPGWGVDGFQHPWWVRPLELIPVLCAIAFLGDRGKASSREEFGNQP